MLLVLRCFFAYRRPCKCLGIVKEAIDAGDEKHNEADGGEENDLLLLHANKDGRRSGSRRGVHATGGVGRSGTAVATSRNASAVKGANFGNQRNSTVLGRSSSADAMLFVPDVLSAALSL